MPTIIEITHKATPMTPEKEEIRALKQINADLLAACETALAVLEQDWEGDTPSITGNMLRAAIAKAKGANP